MRNGLTLFLSARLLRLYVRTDQNYGTERDRLRSPRGFLAGSRWSMVAPISTVSGGLAVAVFDDTSPDLSPITMDNRSLQKFS